MDIKQYADFSERDQIELTKMIEAMQKLKAPEKHPTEELYYDQYSFFLGRGKQFRIERIK